MTRAHKYYEAGEGRARRVEELFDRIAPRYDLINDLQSGGLHRLWKRRLVRLAEVPDGGAALDLCCGTGDIVRSLARAYPEAASIVGLDFSAHMLGIAALRAGPPSPEPDPTSPATPAPPTDIGPSARPGVARGRKAGRIAAPAAYVRADALRLPWPAASFDRVTISYGLRNVADIDACLAEVRRVLRPGGRFLILEFGKPPNPVVARAYFAYLRAAIPLFGRIFFRDPDTHGYIHDSLMTYPSQLETAERLRRHGFPRVRVENPLFGVMGLVVGEM